MVWYLPLRISEFVKPKKNVLESGQMWGCAKPLRYSLHCSFISFLVVWNLCRFLALIVYILYCDCFINCSIKTLCPLNCKIPFAKINFWRISEMVNNTILSPSTKPPNPTGPLPPPKKKNNNYHQFTSSLVLPIDLTKNTYLKHFMLVSLLIVLTTFLLT